MSASLRRSRYITFHRDCHKNRLGLTEWNGLSESLGTVRCLVAHVRSQGAAQGDIGNAPRDNDQSQIHACSTR